MATSNITKDGSLLTMFRRRSDDFMWQRNQSKRPVVFTVKVRAATVVEDAEAYQRLLGVAARRLQRRSPARHQECKGGKEAAGGNVLRRV
jgi:hypothetical protein